MDDVFREIPLEPSVCHDCGRSVEFYERMYRPYFKNNDKTKIRLCKHCAFKMACDILGWYGKENKDD